MSEKETEFLKEVDMRYKRLRSLAISVISILLITLIGGYFLVGQTASANSTNYKNHEKDYIEFKTEVELMKFDMVDAAMFRELMESFAVQCEIMLSIKDGHTDEVDEVQRLFNDWRIKKLYGLENSNTRSGEIGEIDKK